MRAIRDGTEASPARVITARTYPRRYILHASPTRAVIGNRVNIGPAGARRKYPCTSHARSLYVRNAPAF